MLQFFTETVMENPRQHKMGRDEFRQWAEQQEGARYERVNGEPVAMAPERAIHARLKARVWRPSIARSETMAATARLCPTA
jgi:hypothetical protein